MVEKQTLSFLRSILDAFKRQVEENQCLDDLSKHFIKMTIDDLIRKTYIYENLLENCGEKREVQIQK